MLIFSVLFLCFVGLSDGSETLTRIDVQESSLDSEVIIITNDNQISKLENILKNVQWEEAKVQKSRKEDVKLTYFYQYGKNMPERLEEYLIWFNENHLAEFIDSNENKYGKLNKEDAQKLKRIIK